MDVNTALQLSYWGNTIYEYIIAAGVFLICVCVLWIFRFLFTKRLQNLAEKTKNDLDDLLIKMVGKLNWPFYVFLSFYIGVHLLVMPERLTKYLDYILMITVVCYSVRVIQSLIDFSAKRYMASNGKDTSSVKLLSKILKGALWIIAIVVMLSNLGVNISGLVAGLGITGIAIAFALQRILEDIFASFSIHLDKPFVEGDFITIDDDSGTVKKIGIKSTRLQTQQGEELVVSNRELTEARVHNYKKMKDRRVTFSFGVSSETPIKKLRNIPKIVKEILKKFPEVKVDRAHLKSMSDYSYIYEVVYSLSKSDYTFYLDVNQEIQIQLIERFNKEKIVMPLPTQSVIVKRK
ncbi:mechanosensitive ion channel family protein [Candidatus Woesearchaeota archaeon]|nr:mechanosensitive ion channel family protein [Candidatus Woesearchaeota archaeon]